MKVAIIGGNGQLGQCISKDLYNRAKENMVNNEYVFLGHNDIDISWKDSVKEVLSGIKPDIIINCAAYTNVDKAEQADESDIAKEVNMDGPIYLARYCEKNNVFLIHISTDFVFNGAKHQPYKEYDVPIPLSVYGTTKYLGENGIRGTMSSNYLIFRTSWLYSEFGNNFVKKMADRIDNGTFTQVVCDQIGSPTYAMDLAHFLVEICEFKLYEGKMGIYHFANGGYTTWYDLAKRIEIYRKGKDDGIINPWFSFQYGTMAERPIYSVLDNTKVQEDFGYHIPYWSDSLEKCVDNI